MSSHQSLIPFWGLSRKREFSFGVMNRERAAVVVFASPTKPTSTGKRKPIRSGLSSIWTPLASFGFGKYSIYGNDEPIINNRSQSSIASTEGVVPSKPSPPVHSG